MKHDIGIMQDAQGVTKIWIDKVMQTRVLSYHITQEGPMRPIKLVVTQVREDEDRLTVTTEYPVGRLAIQVEPR